MELSKWEFSHLLYQYLENYYYFKWQYHFHNYPFRYELKKLEAVLNAFTGKKYNIESDEDRDEIQELIEYGFDLGDTLCSDKQLEKLKELFPHKVEIFNSFKQDRPSIGEFYLIIFDVLRYGFHYITTPEFYEQKYPPEANIVHTFKDREIDKHIDDNDDILIEAIIILLGDELCSQSFTRKELQDKYNYPKYS